MLNAPKFFFFFFCWSADAEWQIWSQLLICYFALENFQSFFYVYEHNNCVPYYIWVVSSIRVVFYNLPKKGNGLSSREVYGLQHFQKGIGARQL